MLTNEVGITQEYIRHIPASCPERRPRPAKWLILGKAKGLVLSGAEGHKRTQPGKGETPVSNLSALIIEDNDDLADIFAVALQMAGFETRVVGAGDTALMQLSSATPDLVILDLNLPRVSGAEILHHIRADTRLAGTRVIVATAYPRMAEDLQEEADLVLLKPVSFIQLRDLAMCFGPGVL